ncbi:MAG: hypothetical protein OEW78_09695 [Nitrosopumilus sp.]|uniref:hypothetical protein n=1 Tax=Nitrosopumilus sp. TaxID=2024843 RepID=UPI00246C0243|nr:hypothetical protein [Nitrosopumilus sp.]MDH5432131.1 hypothetical protein [Nitrosopumilus sp.]
MLYNFLYAGINTVQVFFCSSISISSAGMFPIFKVGKTIVFYHNCGVDVSIFKEQLVKLCGTLLIYLLKFLKP